MGDETREKQSPEGAAVAAMESTRPAEKNTLKRVETEEAYPPKEKVFLIMVAIYISMFLVALDRTILGTAIPKITDDFHSITDVGWYASSYLLTSCAFQLVYGRICTFYSPKWILMWAIAIFEVGSALCGAAPSSKAFIVGRAISGLGSAGIFSGCANIMVITIPLQKRPIYQGIFGAIFGVASILGPLVGGAFTTKVSWRWCFYINLPLGAVVALILFFILENKPSKNTYTLKQQLIKLDPWGQLVFLPGIICLLLALQWGGTTYPWGSWRIILCFVLAFVLLTIFVVIQFKSGDNATVPIRIIKQRSIASGVYFSLMLAGAMMIAVYYLPLYFQAIKNVNALKSGINTLPLVLSLVVASIIGGIITKKTGYYVGQLYACTIIMSIGAGLYTILQIDSSQAMWVGYQFLFGFGLGFGMQQAGMAAQACLDRKDVMTGVALMFFCQGLGGTIWISVAQVIFANSLVKKLLAVMPAGVSISTEMIVHTGATEIRDIVPAQYLPMVLKAYGGALQDVFKLCLACACATIIGGLTMEWRSIKGKNQGGPSTAPPKNDVENGTALSDVEARPESATPAISEKNDLHNPRAVSVTDSETATASQDGSPAAPESKKE